MLVFYLEYLILRLILPLTWYHIFFLLLFYLNFSSREKLQKRPSHVKISHNSLLLTSCRQHSSVGCCLPQTTFRSNSGERTTRCSRKNIITYMHRSNNSSPYPLFERLFAVILSVPDIKEITFGGCIAEVIPKKKPALCETQQVLVHIAGMRREFV